MTWPLILSAFTAAGTVAMAVATFAVILQSKRHHRDTFRPVCVLVPDRGLDAAARRDLVRCHEEPGDPTKYFAIDCGVKNVGVGPAVRLKLAMSLLSNPMARPEVELSPLGAEQSILAPLRLPVFLHDRFNQTDYQLAPGEAWELWLTYEDVFGNIFRTRHSKNPQEPWGALGREGAEIKPASRVRAKRG